MDFIIDNGMGRIRIISMSKIKKMRVILKNRRENGDRPVEKDSNPHSKGDIFSLSKIVFLLIRMKIVRIIITIKIIKNDFINLLKNKSLWLEVICTEYTNKLVRSSINKCIEE